MDPLSPRVVRDGITRVELAGLAQALFGDMVKGVVDVQRGVMAVGGELHSDEGAMLMEGVRERIRDVVVRLVVE